MLHVDWTPFYGSVRGASHKRRELKNQDYVAYRVTSGIQAAHILAVADGHGSPACSRSDIGAKLAVECALDEIQNYFEQRQELSSRLSSNDDSLVEEKLNREISREVVPAIVKSWQSRVSIAYHSSPEQSGPDEGNILLKYGSTLNVVAVTEGLYIALKIGDGNIVLVFQDGTIELPAATVEPQIGDETDSLCQSDAERAFQVKVGRLNFGPPVELAMLLVCTDGFRNAFSSSDGFLKAAADFAQLTATQSGRENLKNCLEEWLEEYSEYSGDDVTVGILASSCEV